MRGVAKIYFFTNLGVDLYQFVPVRSGPQKRHTSETTQANDHKIYRLANDFYPIFYVYRDDMSHRTFKAEKSKALYFFR